MVLRPCVLLWEEQSVTTRLQQVATYAILVFLQGVGNILVGPTSAGLLPYNVRLDAYGILMHKDLVIFTGACMFMSAVVIGVWYLRPKKVTVA